MSIQELYPETLRPIPQEPFRPVQRMNSHPIFLNPVSDEALGRCLPSYAVAVSLPAVNPVPDVVAVDAITIPIDPEREAQDQSQDQPPLYEN